MRAKELEEQNKQQKKNEKNHHTSPLHSSSNKEHDFITAAAASHGRSSSDFNETITATENSNGNEGKEDAFFSIDEGLMHSELDDEKLEKAIEELTSNVNFRNGDDIAAEVTFKVFDLGGQSTFYVFHPFFLTT